MTAAGRIELLRASRLRHWYLSARGRAETLPLSLIQLAMRVAIGGIFFKSGLLKVRSFEFAVKLFEQEYQLPLLDPTVAARLAAFAEITFPLFLFAGLATRFAVLPLLFMTAVIQWVYPDAWVENLLWASVMIFLLTRGAGVFSLDYLIERRLGGGR